jgi:solute carrier family 30 (zinc transporter), member 9
LEFAVLGVSLLLEGYSLLVAVRTVLRGAQQAGVPFLDFVRRGADPTSIAVMMEDSGAVAGLIVAGEMLNPSSA